MVLERKKYCIVPKKKTFNDSNTLFDSSSKTFNDRNTLFDSCTHCSLTPIASLITGPLAFKASRSAGDACTSFCFGSPPSFRSSACAYRENNIRKLQLKTENKIEIILLERYQSLIT